MDLLTQFARGDLEAFEGLFRQFQAPIYAWIVRIVRDPALAEDLTVETFLRMYQCRARIDPEKNFAGWARRIATNIAIDSLRRRKPESALPDHLPQPQAPDAAIQQEVRMHIQQAFRSLPAKLQAAATLALIEERPYDEVAAALGVSIGAVKLRVFRAVRILRKQLLTVGVHP